MKRHQAVRAAALSAVICGGLQQAAWAQLRAFGEAEGFGATVTGGRAATTVYHVTNLNDSGAGSFRDAVSGSNRIIVFDVGGVINLKSAVSCKSNLTIAGQTAPGGGISLNGAEVSFSSQSNIICRYLHFRPGDGSSGSDAGVALYNSRNVILDHSSIEFAKYDNIDAVTDNGNDPNITVQSSIIADPISNGSSNTGQGFGAHLEAVGGHMTLVNNLWANSHNRNPLAKVNDQFVNNIDYNNEASYTTHTSTPFSHDLVNNAFIYGPATGGNTFYQLSGGDKFYANGNVQDANLDGLLNGSAIDPVTASGTGTSKSSPNFSTTAGLPTLSVAAAYAYVLAHAGASLTHDELDSLVLSQLATLGNGTAGTGTGTSGPDNGLYHSAASTGLANGGLGVTAAGSRAAGFDADNDGIADTWEVAHGLSPSDPTDAFKLNPLGYLMIEQYLNELGSTNDSHTSQASNANWNSPSTWGDATVPTAMDYAVIRGNGTASGSVVVNGAASAMKISLGGNGSSTGESLSVVGGGNLSVYDTITVGDLGDATLAITGGSLSAYNIQLGNTLNGLTHTGTLNFSAGTLGVSQIVLGGGTPGAWTTGGSMNWTGGTLQAIAAMNINVPIALGGTAGVIDTNGYNATISGPLTGSIGLTKTGAGTLTLSGNSTFTGGVKVNADTLSINSTNGAGTGGVTLANGTTLNLGGPGGSSVNNPILVQQNATLTGGYITAGGTISGAAGARLAITTATTYNLTLAGDLSAFAGTFDFGASTGNIRLNGAGAAGSASAAFDFGSGSATLRTVSGATVNLGSLSGSNTAATLQGAQNNANAVTYVVGANGQSTSFAGTITDGVYSTPGLTNLTKAGAGTLTLANGANTYTGVTTIRAGTLSVGTLANGGAASAIGDSASDAANLVIDGGTLQYTGGASTIDRAFTLTANGGAIERNGTGNFIFGSTADVAMPGSGDRTLTLAGTSTSFNNFNLGLSDPSTGQLSLVKTGAGTWRIGGNAKTYSGDTTINAGSLYLIASNVLPSGSGRGNVTVAGGATLDMYGSNQSINGLNGAGTVTTTLNTTRTLTVGNNDADGNFSGTLTQGGNQTLALAKVGAGTQILGGTNTFTGTTTVSAGVLSVNGSINSSPVNVQGGTLGGNGSVLSVAESANGTVGPGNSIGTLSVIQNAALAGHLAVQLNGAGAGSADLLNVAGALTLTGGTVDFSTLPGGTPPDDPAYVFASYGTLVGTFAAVTGLPNGYAIDYAYNNGVSTNNIALVQSAVPEPAGLALLSLAAATGLRRRRRVA